jgi:hypothetical protein
MYSTFKAKAFLLPPRASQHPEAFKEDVQEMGKREMLGLKKG